MTISKPLTRFSARTPTVRGTDISLPPKILQTTGYRCFYPIAAKKMLPRRGRQGNPWSKNGKSGQERLFSAILGRTAPVWLRYPKIGPVSQNRVITPLSRPEPCPFHIVIMLDGVINTNIQTKSFGIQTPDSRQQGMRRNPFIPLGRNKTDPCVQQLLLGI